MLVDYHMHTPLCNHADGEPEEFVKHAIALGLDEIGFAEHSPWMIQRPHEKLAPTNEEFDRYVQTIQALQQKYGESSASPIPIRLGIEMDYVAARIDLIRDYQDKYPWDYIIGSVHHLDGWGFDNPAYVAEFGNRDINQVYEAYFAKVEEMVATGLFDVVGHIDLIKKFGHRPKGDIESMYRHLAACIKRANVAVEINTSGLDKDVREFYPALGLLATLVEERVPLTFGSDAHRPGEVGRYFAEAQTMLRDAGVREIAVFQQRQRRFVPL